MKDTFITGNPEQNERYVKAYNKKGERIPPITIPAMNGAGALKSTIHDVLLFRTSNDIQESPLKQEIEFSHKIHSKNQRKDFNMRLGGFIEQKKSSDDPILHHGGDNDGVSYVLWFY